MQESPCGIWLYPVQLESPTVKVILDLSEMEDKDGEADVPIAMMPRTGEITLLQRMGTLQGRI